MVVCSEVDACLPYNASTSVPPSSNPAVGRNSQKRKRASGSSSNCPDVKIVRGGSSDVPQTHLLEIKAKCKNKVQWSKTYPQLYLSRTPNLYHAFHQDGTFTSIKKFELGGNKHATENNSQEKFKMLRKLLGNIQVLVRNYGVKRISLVCVENTLSIYQIPEGEKCLPEDALALFIG